MKKAIVASDGSSTPNPGKMAIGFVITEDGVVVKKIHRKLGWGTNNQAEVNAMLECLRQTREMGYEEVIAKSDSELLCNHYNGSYRVKNPDLKKLHKDLKFVTSEFKSFDLSWHPREAPLAQAADALSNGVTDVEKFLV
jgi:ribonuclease HI